jgi:hypothetical protein
MIQPLSRKARRRLMAYHKLLCQKHQALLKIQAGLLERKNHADTSSARRAELSSLCSSASRCDKVTGRGGAHKRGSCLPRVREGDRRVRKSTFTEDTLGKLVAETLQGAIFTATTYLLEWSSGRGRPRILNMGIQNYKMLWIQISDHISHIWVQTSEILNDAYVIFAWETLVMKDICAWETYVWIYQNEHRVCKFLQISNNWS